MKPLENVFQRTNETVFDVDSSDMYNVGSTVFGDWEISCVRAGIVFLEAKKKGSSLHLNTQKDVDVLYNILSINSCEIVSIIAGLYVYTNSNMDFRGMSIECNELHLDGSKEIKDVQFKVYGNVWCNRSSNEKLKVKDVTILGDEKSTKIFINDVFFPSFKNITAKQIVITDISHPNMSNMEIVDAVFKNVKHHSRLEICPLGTFRNEIKVASC